MFLFVKDPSERERPDGVEKRPEKGRFISDEAFFKYSKSFQISMVANFHQSLFCSSFQSHRRVLSFPKLH